MNPIQHAVAERIFEQLLVRLQSAASLPAGERDLIRRCCVDAADLQLRAMATPDTAEARTALLREKAHVDAQLSSLVAAGAVRVNDAFWDAVRSVVNTGVAITVAAL